MHLYNRWLPPPVSEDVVHETQKFKKLVEVIQRSWQPDVPSSALKSLQWIPVVKTFVKAKSDLEIADLEMLVGIGLDLFLKASNYLFLQTRWANCLGMILKKYRHKLTLQIEWRPLYEVLLSTHFRRRSSYDGLWLKYNHLESLIYLIQSCRRFFNPSSPTEIWSQLSSCFDDLSHNSALEAAGLISLFLPTLKTTSKTDQNFFTSDFLEGLLKLWSAVPNSHYWNLQWAALLSRCIKHRVFSSVNWQTFLPNLFMQFMNSFEVPVGKSGAWSPVYRSIPADVKRAFDSYRSPCLSKVTAKSIVFLLSPDSSAQSQFSVMVDLLELYYHPSNGGSWTQSLERFLHYLAFYFMKRLASEEQAKKKCQGECSLTPSNREAFVRSLIQLIERGQYSKDNDLSSTSTFVASQLAFVEPSIILPLIISRFYTAMETITATHQLESALKTLALATRSILLILSRGDPLISVDRTLGNGRPGSGSLSMNVDRTILVYALFKTLPGIDANDQPKTLATIQFYTSVISCVKELNNFDVLCPPVLNVDWFLWTDQFLSHLFGLLVNLESSNHPSDDDSDDGFLMEVGSCYTSLLWLLFGKMSAPLYEQGLKKVVKFVHGTILPGAVEAVGDLCCAVVYGNRSMAFQNLLEPIMKSIVTSLGEFPSTGFSGSGKRTMEADFKTGLSPALERTISYQLNILAKAVRFGGQIILLYNQDLDRVINAAFDAPSTKVNDAGNSLLSSVLETMIFYYPLDSSRTSLAQATSSSLEEWLESKGGSIMDNDCGPNWHIPNGDEVESVNGLLKKHLRGSLDTIKAICEDGYLSKFPGQEKDYLHVLLLRLEACLHVGSCIPDFKLPLENVPWTRGESQLLTVAGRVGPTVGSPTLRSEVANVVHKFCSYLLKDRVDDSYSLRMLVHVMDMVGNYGSVEYTNYLHNKDIWEAESKILSEPHVNIITNTSSSKHRPRWLLFHRVYVHNEWRASQAGYQPYHEGHDSLPVPAEVLMLSEDLLKLSLHNYSGIRAYAANKLEKMLQRYPSLVQKSLNSLTSSLQDPNASEESALGSCKLLMSRPIIRHLRQDLNDLSSFLLAILGSAHHESIKAQNAINELFVIFTICFGGVPPTLCSSSRESDGYMAYSKIVSHIKDLVTRGSIKIHWRYNLMAHGILLFLVLPPPSFDNSFEVRKLKLREAIAGLFLMNLRSELPPLRPLSVVALLFLLESSSEEKSKGVVCSEQQRCDAGCNSLARENDMIAVLQNCGFGDSIVKKLAVDRQYSEDQNDYIPKGMSDMELTSLMPANMREWPYTRTWESDIMGDQFSPIFAKLFERLVQEFGSCVLDALHNPLEEALCEFEDHGRQCIAAEIIAGLLHSDAVCVVKAWNEWLKTLLNKALLHPALLSVPEWAACARFAVGGKGRNGKQAPLLRFKIVKCLAEPLPTNSATNLVTKRLTILRAALLELLPTSCSEDEIVLQENLLSEAMDSMTHIAPQVREGVGKMLCILCSNLFLSRNSGAVEMANKACTALVEQATVAAAEIHKIECKQPVGINLSTEKAEGPASNIESKDASRQMETILHFARGSIKSGRAETLMNTIVGLIHPVLALQGIREKDLSALAKSTFKLLQWQPFLSPFLSDAVSAVLSATSASNWHTRVAALTFIQPLVYRHRFLISSSDIILLWEQVKQLLTDNQLEVREAASLTLTGMMKGSEDNLAKPFRDTITNDIQSMYGTGPSGFSRGRLNSGQNIAKIHGLVLGLSACILSVPYDIPSWLPGMITDLAMFIREPWPIKGTVTKTVGEFRRTHADTWELQKEQFTEEQLEVLCNLNLAASYFA